MANSKVSHITFLCLIGRGGSGKDTQAEMLVEKIGSSAVVISTGEVLRAAMDKKAGYERFTSLVLPYKEQVENGELLPPQILHQLVTRLIREAIEQGKTTLIFTGWPRVVEHVRDLDTLVQQMKEEGIIITPQFICLHISEEVSRNRAEKRRETSDTKREDDKEDVVEQRLKTFKDLTEPMVKLLVQTNKLPASHIINADEDKEKIYTRVTTVLKLA